MKIDVLGGGLVGTTMARDLLKELEFEVTLVDIDPQVEENIKGLDIHFKQADLGKKGAVKELAEEYDLCIGALPGFMGFAAMKEVIEGGTDLVDISFIPENAEKLDGLARKMGVTAVFDCGVAPGLSNMMVGRSLAMLDSLDKVKIYVGGLPYERTLPYQYKAPFSPVDVLEEYTREAKIVRNGRKENVEALSGSENVEVPGIGTLEAFYTDGLRSLVQNIEAKNMEEKTLRYPGHRELIEALRESGFLRSQPVELNGHLVRPIDLTKKLLFPMWKLKPGEKEFTYLRVEVSGRDSTGKVRHLYELMDSYDPASGESSMSRTTGFPCTAVARLVVRGEVEKRGVIAPETLGKDVRVYNYVENFLKDRGVNIEKDGN